LYVSRLSQYSYGVMVNWKGFGNKGSWLNGGTVSALVWKTEENNESPHDSRYRGLDINRSSPEYIKSVPLNEAVHCIRYSVLCVCVCDGVRRDLVLESGRNVEKFCEGV
jgi:hypothetical protein